MFPLKNFRVLVGVKSFVNISLFFFQIDKFINLRFSKSRFIFLKLQNDLYNTIFLSLQGVPPPEQPEDRQAQQGSDDAPHECRKGKAEGTGAHRERTSAPPHAGG